MIDSELIERFVVARDSSAFRDLVARHGPRVLRVCRKLVQDQHEAEDAMQATFLILVERAPSIQNREQLDRWLAGVARKVAARARKRAIRRSEREQRWAETHREATLEPEKPVQLELRRAVREELGQLAEADRQPLTLCYLDGLTHEEAASRIGCPVGTIKARLVRARRKLRDRLDRRGVALSLGLLLILLRRPSSASASDLAESTASAMAWSASGDSEAIQAMFPRAYRLMRPSIVRTWMSVQKTRFALLVGMIAVVWCAGALLVHASTVRSEAQKASIRLLKVLDVNCRIAP